MIFFSKCRITKFHTLLFFIYINSACSVPVDYCFADLDKGDCGLPPTPVFSYIKPGSRCELKTWRGCPTENLFWDEYQCSDLCIGKLYRNPGEEQTGPPDEEEDKENSDESTTQEAKEAEVVPNTRCNEPLNIANCTEEETQVFTFDNATRTCLEATYHGCEAENKFDNKEQCENLCLNKKDKWEKSINNLKEQDLENIEHIVEKAAEPDGEHPEKEDQTIHPEQLKHHVQHDKAPKVEEPDKEKESGSIEEAVVIRQGEKKVK